MSDSDHQCKRGLVDAFYCIAQEDDAMSATLITNPLFEDTEFYEGSISALTWIEVGQITLLPSSDDEAKLMDIFQIHAHAIFAVHEKNKSS